MNSSNTEKEKLYHQIALACLKALKGAQNGADSKDQIREVYEAIDIAFNEQFALLAHEVDDQKQRLDAIALLDPEQHQLVDAIALAKSNSAAH